VSASQENRWPVRKTGIEREAGMTESPLNIAYRIETDRLLIRCWWPADAPVLRAAID